MQGEQTKQGAGSGGPDRLAAVRARIDELGKISRQLDASRTAAKRTRLGITIVILLVVLGFAWIWFSAVHELYARPEPFVAEVRTLMLNPASGTLKEVITVAKDMVPVYQKEFQNQFGAEWPNIRKQIETEGQRLLKVVPAKAEQKVKDKLEAFAKAQKNALLKEFPELKDEKAQDIVMTSLEAALQDAILDVFQKRIAKAEDRLNAVHEKLLKLMPSDNPENIEKRVHDAWNTFLLEDLQQLKP